MLSKALEEIFTKSRTPAIRFHMICALLESGEITTLADFKLLYREIQSAIERGYGDEESLKKSAIKGGLELTKTARLSMSDMKELYELCFGDKWYTTPSDGLSEQERYRKAIEAFRTGNPIHEAENGVDY